MKYFLVCLLAISAFSCTEDPVLRGDDDEPIIIPPPKPKPNSAAPLDSIQ